MSDERPGGESDHGVNENLIARVRQRREEIVARQQAIEDGNARPEVYEAIDRARDIADEAPEGCRDEIQKSVVGIVSDEFGRRERAGEPIDAAEIDAAVATRLRKYIDNMTSPSLWLPFTAGRNSSLIGSIRSDLIEAARPLPPIEPVKAPFAEWYAASAERDERQLHALEGLLRLAETQDHLAPWMMVFAAVAAVAAVVAAVAAVAAIVG